MGRPGVRTSVSEASFAPEVLQLMSDPMQAQAQAHAAVQAQQAHAQQAQAHAAAMQQHAQQQGYYMNPDGRY